MKIEREKSLISITFHYLPFSRRPLQDINTDTVVSLLLDEQLDTKIDGLLSKFRGGSRGI